MARNIREFCCELAECIRPLLDAACPALFSLFKKRGGGVESLPVSISKLIVSHKMFCFN